VNSLCNPRFDPISKQPELKHSAVKISKIDLAWQFLACAWVDSSQIFNVQQTLRRYYPHFTYASCVLFGRERQGLLFRAAHSIAVAAEVIHAIELLLGLHGEFVLQYDDIKRGTGRKILIETKQTTLPQKCIAGFSLAGDIAAENWLKQLLLDEEALTITPTLLARSQPAVSMVAGGQQENQVVCTCFNIKAQQIKHSLSSHNGDEKQRLSHLQQTLACGTNCGSCIPQLKQFVREAALID
jgi:assimilatory nitrate reductase catalytic subunit